MATLSTPPPSPHIVQRPFPHNYAIEFWIHGQPSSNHQRNIIRALVPSKISLTFMDLNNFSPEAEVSERNRKLNTIIPKIINSLQRSSLLSIPDPLPFNNPAWHWHLQPTFSIPPTTIIQRGTNLSCHTRSPSHKHQKAINEQRNSVLPPFSSDIKHLAIAPSFFAQLQLQASPLYQNPPAKKPKTSSDSLSHTPPPP